MNNRRSTTNRFGAMLLSLGAAAVVVFALAGPGRATSAETPDQACATVCIDADGAFGPTIPVSLDEDSAASLAAIIGGDAGAARPITMDFMSVDEGAEVVVLDSDDRVATVQLSTGRIGYVPVAWLQSA
ncbi:MAG: hypothetical protein OEP52_02130 [Acidimicrobiia bacterium]|nr:hypothetical protein [Acidimicrobiia bacterium]